MSEGSTQVVEQRALLLAAECSATAIYTNSYTTCKGAMEGVSTRGGVGHFQGEPILYRGWDTPQEASGTRGRKPQH